jgi:hypothetical protein
VAVARVLDRQLVQAELLLHLQQLVLRGVRERHPDEAPGLREVIADLAPVEVRKLAAVLVRHAVDQHGTA